MDHKLITIQDAVVLLDRLEADETAAAWQVITTTYVDIDHKYDEWINFADAHQARAFISGYSLAAAKEFLERAQAWWTTLHSKGSFADPTATA